MTRCGAMDRITCNTTTTETTLLVKVWKMASQTSRNSKVGFHLLSYLSNTIFNLPFFIQCWFEMSQIPDHRLRLSKTYLVCT